MKVRSCPIEPCSQRDVCLEETIGLCTAYQLYCVEEIRRQEKDSIERQHKRERQIKLLYRKMLQYGMTHEAAFRDLWV